MAFAGITIPSGKVSADLENFPVLVRLDDMPSGFWLTVKPDGGDIRVKKGGTDLPFDLVRFDYELRKGALFFLAPEVLAASDNEFEIHWGNSALSLPAHDDPLGRQAVWADYDAVLFYGETPEDHAGGGHLVVGGQAQFFQVIETSPDLGVHQGICSDGTFYYAVDTNRIKKYDADWTLVAQNTTPIADTGLSEVDHLGDPEYHDGKLYIPLEVFPNSPYDNQHIAVFDADDLSCITSFDISAQGHEISGIAYCDEDGLLYATDWTDGTTLYKYHPEDGSFQGTVSLSFGATNISGYQWQGITWWRGAFWLASDNQRRTFRVLRDGTVQASVFGQAGGGGNYEGIGRRGDTLLQLVDAGSSIVSRWSPVDMPMGGGGGVSFPADGFAFAQRSSRPTDFTLGVSFALTEKDGNSAILSYWRRAAGTANTRVTLAHSPGQSGIGLWDHANNWIAPAIDPALNTFHRLHGIYQGTTVKRLYYDGSEVATDTTVSALHAEIDTLLVGREDDSSSEDMRGTVGFVYLRAEVLPPAWLAAEYANLSDPSFYTVTSNAPVVTITSPADGGQHSEGSSITFTATAVDPQDGDVAASLVWTSNRDGQIGTGGSFSTSTLSSGTHIIAAVATDNDGDVGADFIAIRVGKWQATSFSGLSPGALPAHLIQTWDLAHTAEVIEDPNNVISGRAIEVDIASINDAPTAIYWDTPGSFLEGESLVVFATSANPNAVGGAGIRITPGSSLNGYVAYLTQASAFRLGKWVGGTFTQLDSTGFSYQANTPYVIRLNANGTALKAKVWVYGESEPDSWQLEATDSSHAAGYAGMIAQPGNAGDRWFYGIGISTAAQIPAPMPDATEGPDAPTNLVATAIDHQSIGLSWTDNADDETGFKIERAPDVSGSPGTFAQIDTVGANVTTYSDTGLDPETTYWYRVRAFNDDGDSDYSNEDSATTDAAPALGEITDLTASLNNDGWPHLTWTPAENATDTTIERCVVTVTEPEDPEPTPGPTPDPEYEPDHTFSPTDTAAIVHEAVNDLGPGAKLLFGGSPGDRYWEMVIRPLAGQEVRAAAGVTIYGSRLLGSPSTEGGFYVWTVNGAGNGNHARHGNRAKPGFPRAGFPEELFYDGIPKLHVGSKAQLGPGRWYFDYAAKKVYAYDNPAGKEVTVSLVPHAVSSVAAEVRLADLYFLQYANHAQEGVVWPVAGNSRGWEWVLDEVFVDSCHGVGIYIAPYMTIRDCAAFRTGQLGMGGSVPSGVAEGVVIVRGEIAHCNRLFRDGWEGGATKFVRTKGMIVDGLWAHHNDGPGVWFDIDNVDPIIRNCLLEDNKKPGVFLEIGYGGKVYDNIIRRNGLNIDQPYSGAAGILISATADAEVYGNTVYDNGGGIVAIQQNRGSGSQGEYRVTGLNVHDNDVRGSQGYLAGVFRDDGRNEIFSAQANNRFHGNTYRGINALAARFGWLNAARNWGSWRQFGHDTDGTLIP